MMVSLVLGKGSAREYIQLHSLIYLFLYLEFKRDLFIFGFIAWGFFVLNMHTLHKGGSYDMLVGLFGCCVGASNHTTVVLFVVAMF